MSDTSDQRPIRRALVSTYRKEGLEPLARRLNELDIEIYASGGTASYLQSLGIPSTEISSLTQYPELLGGSG